MTTPQTAWSDMWLSDPGGVQQLAHWILCSDHSLAQDVRRLIHTQPTHCPTTPMLQTVYNVLYDVDTDVTALVGAMMTEMD